MPTQLSCPTGDACEVCGTAARLIACEADTSLGVLCATVCEDCHEHGDLPPIGLGHAMRRVLEHRVHTGQPPEDDTTGSEVWE
ncbi:hypothetical protein [Cryptosporangium japonicum]|uniref:Uncharacterized protein n=1 Tax=Cryptosporangium japonicum TaxID=80872 RepID=A0ABP3ELG4_9ACTN